MKWSTFDVTSHDAEGVAQTLNRMKCILKDDGAQKQHMNIIQNVSCLGHNLRDTGLLSKILKGGEKRTTKKQLHHTDS